MVKGDELEERLAAFAVLIIQLCDNLPSSPAGIHIGRELLRSGTSPAPNDAEARSAESRRDFVHKMKIALKEVNGSRVWLKMIVKAELLEQHCLTNVIDECDQLCRIFSASIKTSNTQK